MGEDDVPAVVLELTDGLYDLTAAPSEDMACSDEENEEEVSWQRPPAMEDDDEWRLAAVASLRASAERSETTIGRPAMNDERNDEDRLSALRELREIVEKCQVARAWCERRLLSSCFGEFVAYSRRSSAFRRWTARAIERRLARFSLQLLWRNVCEQRMVRGVRAIRTRRRLARWRVAARARRTAAKAVAGERLEKLRALSTRAELRLAWNTMRERYLERKRKKKLASLVTRRYLRSGYEKWRELARRNASLRRLLSSLENRKGLRSAYEHWRQRSRLSRERSEIILVLARRNQLRDKFSAWSEESRRRRRASAALASWVAFVATTRRRRILDRAHATRLCQKTLDTWRKASVSNRLAVAQRNAIALHHWARSLEARCFASLRKYASRRREKKIQARNALEARFSDMRKIGCAKILAAANASRQMRQEAVRHEALRKRDLAATFFAKWRAEVKRRRRRRRGDTEDRQQIDSEPQQQPILATLPPQRLQRGVPFVQHVSRPRPQPRRLTDSLVSKPPHSTASSYVDSQPKSLDTKVQDEQDKVAAMVAAAVAAAINNGKASEPVQSAAESQPPKQVPAPFRGEDHARTILALQDKLATWQRQKKAWVEALADTDRDYQRALREEYRAWKREIAPEVRRCARRLEDLLLRSDFGDDSPAAMRRQQRREEPLEIA